MSQYEALADRVIKKHMLYSAGVSFLPVPLLDIAAITGVQLKMLAELAHVYGVPFEGSKGKSIVSALIGGVATPTLAHGAVGSAVKIIPVVGVMASAFTMPMFASATTYAIGKVFRQHFASGGTFLDFDPEKVRDHFKESFEKAKATGRDAIGSDLDAQVRAAASSAASAAR